MKFKARLETIKALTDVANCINALANKCGLLMSQTMWTFMVPDHADYTEQLTLHFELDISAVFVGYRLENRDREGIFLEVKDMTAFLLALKAANSVSHTTVKLARDRKQGTILAFIMEESGSQVMACNVPCELKSADLWKMDYEPPQIPVPDVKIRCPQLKHLRTGLLRMTNVTNNIRLTLTPSGGDGANLVCSAQTHAVEVSCYFSQLSIGDDNDDDQEISVTLKLHKLLKAVGALKELQHTNAMLCVSTQYACVFHLKLAHGIGKATLYVSLTNEQD